MKMVLMVAAIVTLVGALCEPDLKSKGIWAALYAVSAGLWIVADLVGGTL